MNILFLTIISFENPTEQGIYIDLLREFSKNGHNVFVVSPREKRNNLETDLIESNGINILKVKTGNLTKTNLIQKGISIITLENIYRRAINKFYGNINFDLILYSTPPITFDRIIKHFKKKHNAKTYLMLKDIFPQNAVDLKILSKQTPLYLYFRHKEMSLYRNADHIGCMSEQNLNYILKNNRYLNKSKVEVCPNSITPLTFCITDEIINEVKKKYKLPVNKTIFIYGGNLGKPQGVPFIINTISKNEQNDQSFILIIGSGTEYISLEKYFKNVKPKNAKLINYLQKKDYELLVSISDVGLIYLDHRFTIPNFPSRLLSYMQASIPVLAATDLNTDIGKVITDNNFGFWCESDNVDEFNNLLNKLLDSELRKKLGNNARVFLENNYTSKDAFNIIMRHYKQK